MGNQYARETPAEACEIEIEGARRYNHYAIKVEDIDGTCSELVDRGLVVDGPI